MYLLTLSLAFPPTQAHRGPGRRGPVGDAVAVREAQGREGPAARRLRPRRRVPALWQRRQMARIVVHFDENPSSKDV